MGVVALFQDSHPSFGVACTFIILATLVCACNVVWNLTVSQSQLHVKWESGSVS